MIPGTSVAVAPPWRRAIRWTTRTVYVSSSFVPKITSRNTLTAATRRAASSAQPKLSTTKVFSSRSEASLSTTALRIRTSTKPSASMQGRRSAASKGGSTAFSAATTAATASAPPYPATSTPGRIIAAAPSDAAVSAHESRTRSGLNFGRSGFQETPSPYRAAGALTVNSRPSRRASPPSSRPSGSSVRRP